MKRDVADSIPDVRDGLTRVDRLVLYTLHQMEKEMPGRTIPTAMLYGRLVEAGLIISPETLSQILQRLGAGRVGH